MARSKSWMIKSKDSWSDQGGCSTLSDNHGSGFFIRSEILKKFFHSLIFLKRESIKRENILERENFRERKF